MNKLPVISGRDLIRYLTKKKGFIATRSRGSHVILKSNDKTVTVPLHSELDRGTLLNILEKADLNRDEFIEDWGS